MLSVCVCVCVYVCMYVCTYVCNKNQQNANSCINDLIQLYCLRHVSNNQVFILMKICICSFMVVFSCIHINSLVDVRILRMNTWLFETCRRQYNWIKLLMKKVCIFLVLITYVYHNARLKNVKYTACHRRNGPNFGRVFLMLNYTEITQNTYIQS